ncbi:hypothetical protein Nepgr_028077 [Nepenthes gracilis]|uniref:Uncharacterized protein n=1 Tax=Nepenthes gracilis TaxID=150966 RepID=A0AAD3Y3R3_NEPGR|nr:hypothetical protein Nepgr_028077 [Nepenthes gracilis]
MVNRKTRENTQEELIMAMARQRSRSLHSFSMPCLKWGRQKHLRCRKIPDADHLSSLYRRSPMSSFRTHRYPGESARNSSEPERKRRSLFEPMKFKNSMVRSPVPEIERKSLIVSGDDNGIEAVRAKLMLDFQTEIDKIKVAILREGNDEIRPFRSEFVEAQEIRPWSLRTRKATRQEPVVNRGGGDGAGACCGRKSLRADEWRPDLLPLKTGNELPRLRGEVSGGNGRNGGGKRPSMKFSVSLSKQEIEEDFFAFWGTRPSRKPKKRPKYVQKQFDALFPGLRLPEITPDIYKANESLDAGKR